MSVNVLMRLYLRLFRNRCVYDLSVSLVVRTCGYVILYSFLRKNLLYIVYFTDLIISGSAKLFRIFFFRQKRWMILGSRSATNLTWTDNSLHRINIFFTLDSKGRCPPETIMKPTHNPTTQRFPLLL